MGFKKVLPVFELVENGAMTGTSVITSEPVTITNLDNVAVQAEWTGTPTGVLQIMLSGNGSTYFPLTFSPDINQPAGSSGALLALINQAPPFYLQVEYTNASGTGALDVWVCGKDLN